jgi:membrane protease YdiL (CAAX protease family)
VTDERYPGFWQALILLLLVLLLQFLLGGLATLLPAAGRSASPDPLVIGLIALLAGVVTAAFGWWRRGGPFGATFPLRPVRPALLVAVILTTCGLSILLSDVGNLLELLLPIPSGLARLFESLTSGEQGLLATVFALSIAAPLAEEPLLRGVILAGLRSRYSERTAIVVSAVLFGILHVNPWQFVSAAGFGIVAAWWVLRAGSLVPALLGHAVGNALPVLVNGLHLVIPGYTTSSGGHVEFQPWWFNALGLLLLTSGLSLAARSFAPVAPSTARV